MAKKQADASDNASQAIRDYFDGNRQAKPKVIAAELKKKGFNIGAQYVSVILSQYRKKLGLGYAAKGRPRNTLGPIGVADLKLVKELVARTGSPEKARQAIDTYIELMH